MVKEYECRFEKKGFSNRSICTNKYKTLGEKHKVLCPLNQSKCEYFECYEDY